MTWVPHSLPRVPQSCLFYLFIHLVVFHLHALIFFFSFLAIPLSGQLNLQISMSEQAPSKTVFLCFLLTFWTHDNRMALTKFFFKFAFIFLPQWRCRAIINKSPIQARYLATARESSPGLCNAVPVGASALRRLLRREQRNTYTHER